MRVLEKTTFEGDCLTRFEETVSALDSLPTMPAIAQKLLALTSSDDCSFDEIEELIGADQALTVKLMRLASSAAMSARPAPSLRAALVRIGLRDIRKLVVASLLVDSPEPGKLHTQVWQYSLKVAAVCEELSAASSHAIEEPFLCGLLHDFGVVALERVIGDEYSNLGVAAGSDDQVKIEREVFSFDHCDMGALLAREWNLFPTLVSVMQLHHTPLEAFELTDESAALAIAMVSLARTIVFDMDEAVRDEADEERRMMEAIALLGKLGLDEEDAGSAAERGMKRFNDVYASLLS